MKNKATSNATTKRTARKRATRITMNVANAIFIIAFVFVVGSVGAAENGQIGITQMLVQSIVGVVILYFSYYILTNLWRNWR